MKLSSSAFLITTLLGSFSEVKGACTWTKETDKMPYPWVGKTSPTPAPTPGPTPAPFIGTLAAAKAKCLQLGTLACGSVLCNNNGYCDATNPSPLGLISNSGTDTYLPSVDCPEYPGTNAPTNTLTNTPTNAPTNAPANAPTNTPTNTPTNAPTNVPTNVPTNSPTNAPTNVGDTNCSDMSVADMSVALEDRWKIGLPTATNSGNTYNFQYPDMSRLWLGTNTCSKIKATIYGEFCKVDEFPDTCDWTPRPQLVSPGDVLELSSYADKDMFKYTLVEAQVRCLALGEAVCKAVTCLDSDGGLCTVRPTAATISGTSAGDTSYGLPSGHSSGNCPLTPAPSDTVAVDNPFYTDSLTWTHVFITENTEIDAAGETVAITTITPSTDPLLQYSLTGSPQKMEAYTLIDYGTVPTLKFCVRLGLYPDADKMAANTEEIYFYESVVTITVSFDGAFKVEGIDVAPKEQGTSYAAIVYTASALLCGKNNAEEGIYPLLPQAVRDDNDRFNQGAAITVCIELDSTAKADGVIITKIVEFKWEQEGSIIKTQAGILDGDEDDNGLTMQSVITNGGGVGVPNVVVTSVLFAKFYEETGSVKASGSVGMAFARRRLRNTDNRHLQWADPVAAFDVAATLNRADDGPFAIQQTAGGNGGTYSISNAVGVAITSIVGLLVSNTVLLA